MPAALAPQRQHVLTFATPKVKDILFYENEKVSRGEFGRYGRKIPPYGTKHYDKTNSPNHELVFVYGGSGQVDIDGEVTEFGPGTTILFARNCTHWIKNTGDTDMKM